MSRIVYQDLANNYKSFSYILKIKREESESALNPLISVTKDWNINSLTHVRNNMRKDRNEKSKFNHSDAIFVLFSERMLILYIIIYIIDKYSHKIGREDFN